MTEDEMKEFLAENAERIKENVREKMIEDITESYRWDVPDVVQKTVSEFMKEQIVPEIKAHLKSEKSAIIQAAIAGTSGITDHLAKVMIEKAVANMEGYQFREIIKGLFS